MKLSGIDLASVDAETAWVLDVGCGQGFVVLEAAQQGARAVGLDLSPELLCKARGHLRDTPEECSASFVLARSDATPLVAGLFDVLVCTELIEHTLATRETLCEIRRLLKPYGHCILSFPTKYTENIIARFSASFLQYSGHVKQFTLEEMRALLSGHGFEVLQVQRKYFEWSVYWLLMAIFKQVPDFDRQDDRYGLESPSDARWKRVDYYYKRLWAKSLKWKFGIPILWLGNQILPKSYFLLCQKTGSSPRPA